MVMDCAQSIYDHTKDDTLSQVLTATAWQTFSNNLTQQLAKADRESCQERYKTKAMPTPRQHNTHCNNHHNQFLCHCLIRQSILCIYIIHLTITWHNTPTMVNLHRTHSQFLCYYQDKCYCVATPIAIHNNSFFFIIKQMYCEYSTCYILYL